MATHDADPATNRATEPNARPVRVSKLAWRTIPFGWAPPRNDVSSNASDTMPSVSATRSTFRFRNHGPSSGYSPCERAEPVRKLSIWSEEPSKRSMVDAAPLTALEIAS